MDGFGQYCKSTGVDGFSQYGESSSSGGVYAQPTEHTTDNRPSSSDAGTTGGARSCGDEEDGIMLASSHPKKRTGRKKFKETRHPVYRGVRMRNSNRWVCEVREPNKRNRIWLGTYPTAEMAARAHDVAALALRGLKSCLNFADSAWRLPKPASADPEDIQRAAAEAAAMFSIDEEEEAAAEEAAEEADNIVERSSTVVDEDACKEDGENDETYRQSQKSSLYYMDDDALFDMPGLLNDMAEGLLLSPPSYLNCESTSEVDNTEKGTDAYLWNHLM